MTKRSRRQRPKRSPLDIYEQGVSVASGLRHRGSGCSRTPSGDVDEVVQFQPVTNGTRRRDMAGVIQFIEFEATDIDAVAATLERFRDENPGALTASA